jgi:imidazolonepropionase-like amidohydrolase
MCRCLTYFVLVSAVVSTLVSNVAFADQTSHVYGLHDRTNNKTAFVNATVVTEPGKIIKNAVVVIDNGSILSVEQNDDVPVDATIIDLSGHWLYAGFIDPYADYVFGTEVSTPRWGDPPKYEGDRKGGNAWNDAIHAQINWVDTFKADEKAAEPYLKNGFTAVQTARQDGIFRGRGVTVSLADDIPNNVIYNANAMHFGSFNKGSSKQSYPSSLMGSIALIRQTLSDTQWYKQANGKTSSLITGEPVEYNSALASLASLGSEGMVFDAGDSLSVVRAHALFSEYDVNAVYLGDGLEYSRLSQIKNIGATLILPLNFPKAPELASFEDQLDTSLAELRHFERAPGNPAMLEQAGVTFAFTQHGLKDKKDFFKAVNKAIKHGLSESTALAALTTTPAKIAGVDNIAGKIASGYRADLVIADGNLFDGGKIKKVFLQGAGKEFEELAPTNFAATYDVTVGDKSYLLTLEQKDKKVSGSMKLQGDGSFTADLSNVQTSKDQISFVVSLFEDSKTTINGFTGRLIDNDLSGNWLFPDLTRAPIQLVRTDAQASSNDEASSDSVKTKDAKATDKSDTTYLSNLTYPNRAFGLSQPIEQQNLHIKNATIWTSEDEGMLENADMLVRNGKIREIGEDLSTPRGYEVIDATGKHITAGIIDEHSHIAISGGVNEGSDAITSEVRIGDVVNPEDINIYRALAGGTTAAQLLHGSANPIGGQAQVIKLRWGEDADGLKMKQAPPSIKFALGENVKQSNWGEEFTIRYPQTRMGVDSIMRDTFLRAQEYKDSFARFDDLSRRAKEQSAPPRQNFRLDAVLEILENERFVHAHSYVASEILALMELAEDFNFTIQTFTHILEGYKVADEMAKHGASASSFADWWAYKFEVLDAIPGNTCLMMQNGVNVSVNSDSGDLIRRLNTEAAKSINYCGMDPLDAIKMVTINPAKQLKIDEHTGSLAKGKDADFVIWNANPLSIYAKVEQTWIEGRKYFDMQADAISRESLAAEKSELIQKFLTASNNGKKKGAEQMSKPHFAAYLSKIAASSTSGHSHTSNAGSYSSRYLLKDDTVWHCEDNFDYWHYISGKQARDNQSGHTGGHH